MKEEDYLSKFDLTTEERNKYEAYDKFLLLEYNDGLPNIININDDIEDNNKEYIKSLKRKLYKAIEKLTDKQKQVIYLYLKGYTQREIAEELGKNQSTIAKTLYGSQDIRNGKKVFYGGIVRKLQKLCGVLTNEYQAEAVPIENRRRQVSKKRRLFKKKSLKSNNLTPDLKKP